MTHPSRLLRHIHPPTAHLFHPPRIRIHHPHLPLKRQRNDAPRRTIADLSTYLRALAGTLSYLPTATDAPHVKHVQEALLQDEETDAALKEMGYKKLWRIHTILILPEIRTLQPYIPSDGRIVLRTEGPPLHVRLTRNEGLTLFVDIREEAKRKWNESLIEQRKKLEEGVKKIPRTPMGNSPAETFSGSLVEFLDYRIKDSQGQSFFMSSPKEVYCLPFYTASRPRDEVVHLRLTSTNDFDRNAKGLFVNSFLIQFYTAEEAIQFTRLFTACSLENARFWEIQALASWALGKRKEEMGMLPAVGVRELAMEYAFRQISRGVYKRELFGEFDFGEGGR